MKVALVYDRVNKFGGAERVLLTLHEMFPDASLYTSVYNSESAGWAKVFPKIYTSFIQRIPFAKTRHESLPFLMPIAFEGFNFDSYDLVISITSEAAKGIITKPGTLHICYCLTPTRYLWSHYDQYFSSKGRLAFGWKEMAKPIVNYLRSWDKVASGRPDKIIAISSEVQHRIKKYYDSDSEIIFPPVDIGKIQKIISEPLTVNRRGIKNGKRKTQNGKQSYFLIVSRLVAYKKVDLAIEAFNELGLPLIIVGKGREESKLKAMANKNIVFKGFVNDKEIVELMQKANAFIYPQEEDFGITAVEAQAAGCPVIAYKAGGVLDTVIDGITGVFFDKQNKESLVFAVQKFNTLKFNKKELIKNAERFSKDRFKSKFLEFLDKNKTI